MKLLFMVFATLLLAAPLAEAQPASSCGRNGCPRGERDYNDRRGGHDRRGDWDYGRGWDDRRRDEEYRRRIDRAYREQSWSGSYQSYGPPPPRYQRVPRFYSGGPMILVRRDYRGAVIEYRRVDSESLFKAAVALGFLELLLN